MSLVNKAIIILLIFITCATCWGQEDFGYLPQLEPGELLMLGETHFVNEFQDFETDVISYLTENNADTLVVLLETAYCENVFVNRLFEHGDSVLLKQWLDTCASKTTSQYFYRLLLSLYHIQEKNHNLKVVCIDGCMSEKRLLFAADCILSSYPVLTQSAQTLQKKIDSLYNHLYFTTEKEDDSFLAFLHYLQRHLCRYRKDYKRLLTSSDYDYLKSIPTLYTKDFNARENIMFRNVCRAYNEHFRYVSVIGVTHANKQLIQYASYGHNFASKTKPLARQLQERACSPFKKHVKTACIAAQRINFSANEVNDTLTVAPKTIPFISLQMTEDIKEELAAQNKQIAFKVMKPTSKIDSKVQFDVYVLLKEVNSMRK